MVSGTGDGFAAEGHLWGTGSDQVELTETSSAATMRRFRGTRDARSLVFVEEPPERATTVRFDFIGADSLRLQEIDTRVGPPRAFVDEMFVRIRQ
jgi:hypothetical protein